MGPPRNIDPMTHHTMSEYSYHGATLNGSMLVSYNITEREEHIVSPNLISFANFI